MSSDIITNIKCIEDKMLKILKVILSIGCIILLQTNSFASSNNNFGNILKTEDRQTINGYPMRLIHSARFQATISRIDYSSLIMDGEEVIKQLMVESNFYQCFGTYVFHNVPKRTTIKKLQDTLIERSSGVYIHFIKDGQLLLSNFSLEYYGISNDDVIISISGQKYTNLKKKNDIPVFYNEKRENCFNTLEGIDKAKKMLDRMHDLKVNVEDRVKDVRLLKLDSKSRKFMDFVQKKLIEKNNEKDTPNLPTCIPQNPSCSDGMLPVLW